MAAFFTWWGYDVTMYFSNNMINNVIKDIETKKLLLRVISRNFFTTSEVDKIIKIEIVI